MDEQRKPAHQAMFIAGAVFLGLGVLAYVVGASDVAPIAAVIGVVLLIAGLIGAAVRD